MKTCPVGVYMFHEDEGTDRHEANSLSSQFCEPACKDLRTQKVSKCAKSLGDVKKLSPWCSGQENSLRLWKTSVHKGF